MLHLRLQWDDAFGEHAKEANATFTGSMSNMRAALSRIGADIATPAFQDLRDIFNTLTPIIDKVHTALGPLISDTPPFSQRKRNASSY